MNVVPLRPSANHRNDPTPFRLGVNYWPAATGVALWKNFDIDEVHCDMNTIAELGLDVVRVFLTWEDFQPDPEGVKCCSLARLTALCDAVAAEGLKVIVTMNTGHWGGHNWVPSWLIDTQVAAPSHSTISNGKRVPFAYRNPYTDPMARKAAIRLAQAVSKTLCDHQAVLAYDIGNEVDQFARDTSGEDLKNWFEDVIGAVRDLDQKHDITCGFGLQGLLANTEKAKLENSFAFTSMQLDASSIGLARGFLDSDLLPFGCALASTLTRRPCFAFDWSVATECLTPAAVMNNRAPVWVAGEGAAAGFAEELLPKLLEVGATGALVGNFTDVDPSLYGQPPYDTREIERSRGLVRADGSLKPHGQVVRRFAESNPQVQAINAKRSSVLVPRNDLTADALEHVQRMYGSFAAHSPGLKRGQLG